MALNILALGERVVLPAEAVVLLRGLGPEIRFFRGQVIYWIKGPVSVLF